MEQGARNKARQHPPVDVAPVDVADLTLEQCRVLAQIQARRPDALVTLHPSANGVVVEVRLGRQVALARLTPSGSLHPDQPLKMAS